MDDLHHQFRRLGSSIDFQAIVGRYPRGRNPGEEFEAGPELPRHRPTPRAHPCGIIADYQRREIEADCQRPPARAARNLGDSLFTTNESQAWTRRRAGAISSTW